MTRSLPPRARARAPKSNVQRVRLVQLAARRIAEQRREQLRQVAVDLDGIEGGIGAGEQVPGEGAASRADLHQVLPARAGRARAMVRSSTAGSCRKC